MALLSRREVIGGLAAIAAGGAFGRTAGAASSIQTVTGPVAADRLGLTLMHEHVLVDFIGAEQVSAARYDADEVFRVALPHLQRVRALGCVSFVECTPAYLGRDARLLKRLSEAAGLTILTNTGYYGGAKDKHLPRHAFTESAEQLAARWRAEFDDGIDGTGIRPAFMKIGVDEAPLSEVDAKLVRAAAIVSKATGRPVASHTSTGAAALAEIEILERGGVSPGRFIWVHAQNEREASFHGRAARAGAWVEFDGIAEASLARHVELVRQMKTEGLLGRVLVSQDAGWYHVGEPGGGTFRAFDTLFSRFVPALTDAGLTQDDVRQLLVDNPRRALAQDGA